jgi:hypothetical protein
MSMTRKDFVELAAIVRASKSRFAGGAHYSDVIRYFETELADLGARNNPKFKRSVFTAACEAEADVDTVDERDAQGYYNSKGEWTT